MKNKKDPFPVARGGVFLFRENSVQKERIRIIRCFVDRLYGSNPRIITILSCDITRMSGKVGYLLTILDQISKSNDFQLARQIANTPIHQDHFGIVNQEISKKTREWRHSVIESLRLFCLRVFLNTGVVNDSIKDDFTSLIVKDKIKRTADGLIQLLIIIWTMHGNKIYKNEINAYRALQAEESKAQRHEQFSNILTNLGDHHWNEADPDVVEHFRVNSSKREARRIIAQNEKNENELTKRIDVNAFTQTQQYRSQYPSRKERLIALKALETSTNDSYHPSKKSARRIRFENEERVENQMGHQEQYDNEEPVNLMTDFLEDRIQLVGASGGRTLRKKRAMRRYTKRRAMRRYTKRR